MRIGLCRKFPSVFERHPLPWTSVKSQYNTGYSARALWTLVDADGQRIMDSKLLPFRYHRAASLYAYCIPSWAGNDFECGGSPYPVMPVVLTRHPLPWKLVLTDMTMINGTQELRQYIQDAEGRAVGVSWFVDNPDVEQHILVLELAKLAEDIEYRRERGLRVWGH